MYIYIYIYIHIYTGSSRIYIYIYININIRTHTHTHTHTHTPAADRRVGRSIYTHSTAPRPIYIHIPSLKKERNRWSRDAETHTDPKEFKFEG